MHKREVVSTRPGTGMPPRAGTMHMREVVSPGAGAVAHEQAAGIQPDHGHAAAAHSLHTN